VVLKQVFQPLADRLGRGGREDGAGVWEDIGGMDEAGKEGREGVVAQEGGEALAADGESTEDGGGLGGEQGVKEGRRGTLGGNEEGGREGGRKGKREGPAPGAHVPHK